MDSLKVFKISVSTACSAVGVGFGLFCNKTGLRGFEIDTDFTQPPKEIAADALDQLCSGDGLIYDQIICLAVVDYLDETVGPPKEDLDKTLRMEALRDVLTNPGTRHEYLKWSQSWYG